MKKSHIEVRSCGALVKIPVQGVPSLQTRDQWIEPWNAGLLLGAFLAVGTLLVVTITQGVPV